MAEPHITILMATFNGAQYLAAQLDSLLAQSHRNWSLVVSDDGSSDGTVDILRAFDRAHPERDVQLMRGPGQGSAALNFISLLMRANTGRGLTALADQDDVWLAHKLTRAVDHLSICPQNLPGIYASGSIRTTANLAPMRQQRAPVIQPSFRNALVQNVFAGHSTVLNAAAVQLVQNAGIPRNIAFHDWWLYQLVAGAGGLCMLDPAQTVLYRQHGRNAFGAAGGVLGTIKRLKHLLRNDYARWLSAHWGALHDAAPYLTPDARDLIRDLVSPALDEPRSAQLHRLGLHRATARGTTALRLAAHFGRV